MPLNVGDEVKYITGIVGKIVIHYSKIIAVDPDQCVLELENAMKLRFLHKSTDGGIWDTYKNMANGKNVLIDDSK